MKSSNVTKAPEVGAVSSGRRITAAKVITGFRIEKTAWENAEESFGSQLQKAVKGGWEPQGGVFVTPDPEFPKLETLHVLMVKRKGGAK